MILIGLQRKENETVWVQDRTPNPLPNAKNAVDDDKRYSTLSRGLYEEVKEKKQFEQYGRFSLNTVSKKLESLENESNFQFLIDPVVFAWSVDPLAAKFPSWSPYSIVMNNPILLVDIDGREPKLPWGQTYQVDLKNSEIIEFRGLTSKYIEQDYWGPKLTNISDKDLYSKANNFRAISDPLKKSGDPNWLDVSEMAEVIGKKYFPEWFKSEPKGNPQTIPFRNSNYMQGVQSTFGDFNQGFKISWLAAATTDNYTFIENINNEKFNVINVVNNTIYMIQTFKSNENGVASLYSTTSFTSRSYKDDNGNYQQRWLVTTEYNETGEKTEKYEYPKEETK